MKNKVTVIIPAHNEEENIGNVIRNIQNSEIKNEIIVVNNCSDDNTEQIATELGARVVQCHQRGKGYAMEVGLSVAAGSVIAFIDGDLNLHSEDVLKEIITPITEEHYDFVKSTFDRDGGRVTELVAKPLLELLFPNIHRFSQPLSGIIAGKKKFFNKIVLEKDYGVDIGILLDMLGSGARVKEVHIGKIENCSQSWQSLSKMAKEVDSAILKRAKYIAEYNEKECC